MQQDALRLDRWLWRTRFYKTRGQAATAIKSGHVQVNGGRVKVSRTVKAPDKLQIMQSRGRYRLTVTGIPTRRGPVAEAEACYRLDEFADAGSGRRKARREVPHPGSSTGRPDKKGRRQLRALKGRV
jgi:ribosome-associated heat shock protein Hsp15